MFTLFPFIVASLFVISSSAKRFSEIHREIKAAAAATTSASSASGVSSSQLVDKIVSNLAARAIEPFVKVEGKYMVSSAPISNNIDGYRTFNMYTDPLCKDETIAYGFLLNHCSYYKCRIPPFNTMGYCSYKHECDGVYANETNYFSEDCTGTIAYAYSSLLNTQCDVLNYDDGSIFGYQRSACIATSSGPTIPSDSFALESYDDESCSQQPYSYYSIATGFCQSDEGGNYTFSCDEGFTLNEYDNSECLGIPQPIPLEYARGGDCSLATGFDPSNDEIYSLNYYSKFSCTPKSRTYLSNPISGSYASASSYLDSNYASNAFSGVYGGDVWASSYNFFPHWLQLNLDTALAVNSYRLWLRVDGYNGQNPKAWSLSGSNDGSAWTSLDSQSNKNYEGYSVTYEDFDFANNVAYKMYRWTFTENNGWLAWGTYPCVAILDIQISTSSPSSMTYAPSAIPSPQPTTKPTLKPSSSPTKAPTRIPTAKPSVRTASPTAKPAATGKPSLRKTSTPTTRLTTSPTKQKAPKPTVAPTKKKSPKSTK